jgi:arylsulfatase A-like enzyme
MLRDRELLDETALVFTSDHGEGLGWHPEIGHSISAWEEQLDVPLLVRFPRARRGGLVFEPTTSLAAFTPSALDWLGVARPAHLRDAPGLEQAARTPLSADYRDYFSEVGRQSNMDLAEAYPELAERVTHLHIYYCDQHKLMVDPRGGRQLYDLATDPMEQYDLAEREQARLAECEARYQALAATGRYTSFDKKAEPPRPEQVDPDKQLETLRSLGYIQ